jgi:hypothetical protein
MAEGRGSRVLVFACLFVAALSLAVLLWQMRNKCWVGAVSLKQTTSGTIVIENSEVAAWATINNRFDTNDPVGSLRYGVLIQAGVYLSDGGEQFECDSIVVSRSGGQTTSYPCKPKNNPFHWLNVISQNGPSTAPPIDASEAVDLAPLGPDDTCCGKLEKCVVPDTGTACPGWPLVKCDPVGVVKECLRGKKLHSGFEVGAIVTYWRGPNGYQVETDKIVESSVGSPPVDVELDKYTFLLEDPFTLEVWTCSPFGINPQPCNFTKSVTFTDVTSIRITSKRTGQTEVGLHQTPPWPTARP